MPRRRLVTLLGGLLLMVLAAGALAAWRHLALEAELERESTVLHRLASQRADQHDAHLTALSAIATGGETGFEPFLDVAATIIRFYPRIDEVQLVPLDGAPPVGTGPLDAATAGIVREAARASTGEIALLPHPDRPGHYLMVKRSPNTDAARYGLMLGIDADKLLGDAGPFWSRPGVALRLTLPDGHAVLDHPVTSEAIRFIRPLGSQSQPLKLETGMTIGPADLLPPLDTALVLLATGLAYAVALAVIRQRARTRAAMRQAALSALETRLAHASRVNALGEMASGLAHELTQPLTAILAQMQAGRRLLAGGNTQALAPVLDDTIAQARRASGILERFRDWSRPERPAPAPFDLAEALRNVEALLSPEAAAQGVRLALSLPAEPVSVAADPVEMEQVVFNLVRNAIEAGGGHVDMALSREGGMAAITVADDGPGVAEELRPKLFTPFTTTREGGTGLGLALSQRLVERAGGEIGLAEGGPGAAFRVVLPLAKKGDKP